MIIDFALRWPLTRMPRFYRMPDRASTPEQLFILVLSRR